VTASKRSGAGHDGTRSQNGAPAGAAPSPAPEPAPEVGAPPAWPGTAGDTGAGTAAGGTAAGGAAADGAAARGAVTGGPETAEADSADLPLWDWSPPSAEPARPEDQADAEPADPPRPQWKPVVTPVEEAKGTPGIGQRRGNLTHLATNPRMRVWRLRIIVAVIVLVAIGLLTHSWLLGLTLAVLVVIADTIYRSRRGYGAQGRMTGAQRRTSRQLAKLGRSGYHAINGNIIPDSEEQIDHLVVGPTGVFAIDSEEWDKRLAVRTRKGRELWHGPFSMKERLQHAQWEAQQAADLLSGVTGKPVTVRPAMAVYGPKIPWDVATIRDVDVFSGPRLRKYLRRRAKQNGVRPLTTDEIDRIRKAADEAFPHLSSGSQAS